jgi:iron complex transport system substrate-binding protein
MRLSISLLITRCSLIAALFVLSSATAFAYPLHIKDARGKTVTIKSKPMRIVSLAPSNTEILYALGLGGRVVGVTKYCDYPAEAKKKPKIGDMTVSAEAVVALKPDLVLAHAFVNDAAIAQLEKLGLTVFAIDPKTIGQVARDIRTIGRITARPKTADMVAKRVEAAVASVKAACAKRPSRNVLVVVQANPLWVAGPKSFVDEMISLAHAKNVAHDARPGFVTFSKELAISRNPDVIVTGIESDLSYFGKSPEWRTTSAVKNKNIRLIKSDLIVRAGPRLADGLRAIAKALDY